MASAASGGRRHLAEPGAGALKGPLTGSRLTERGCRGAICRVQCHVRSSTVPSGRWGLLSSSRWVWPAVAPISGVSISPRRRAVTAPDQAPCRANPCAAGPGCATATRLGRRGRAPSILRRSDHRRPCAGSSRPGCRDCPRPRVASHRASRHARCRPRPRARHRHPYDKCPPRAGPPPSPPSHPLRQRRPLPCRRRNLRRGR